MADGLAIVRVGDVHEAVGRLQHGGIGVLLGAGRRLGQAVGQHVHMHMRSDSVTDANRQRGSYTHCHWEASRIHRHGLRRPTGLVQACKSDEKVANRETRVWHFVIENGY
jgi:hypothetical protein